MSQILTWEQYSSLHSKVTQDEFTKAEEKAEHEVKQVIGPIRFATITTSTFGYDSLQECIANVIDRQVDDAKSNAGKGITSISNDGYSESYAITKKSEAAEELKEDIRAWLSGTGLVVAY